MNTWFYHCSNLHDFNLRQDLNYFKPWKSFLILHHSLDVFNKAPSKHCQWQPHDLPGHGNLLWDAISLKTHSAPSEGPVGNQSPGASMWQLWLRLHFNLIYKLLLIPQEPPAALFVHFILFHSINKLEVTKDINLLAPTHTCSSSDGESEAADLFPDKQRQTEHTNSSLASSVSEDRDVFALVWLCNPVHWIWNETVNMRLKCYFSALRVLEGIHIHDMLTVCLVALFHMQSPTVWGHCSKTFRFISSLELVCNNGIRKIIYIFFSNWLFRLW